MLAALAAYVVTLVLLAGACFVLVLVLAGPHAGLLPRALEVAVLVAGWAVVLVVPALVARRVWRRRDAGSARRRH